MPTSKIRRDIPMPASDLDFPAEGDLKPYVIFTQLKNSGPFIYAGWVDAADNDMAIQFACEHYGQDQECVGIWAIQRDAIAGTEAEYPTSGKVGSSCTYEVFIQQQAGAQHICAGHVDATNSEQALAVAQQTFSKEGPPKSIWVVRRDSIGATAEGDVIWRLTDQDYRMARGYTKDVREKWEKIRAAQDLTEYEKEDLKEMF